MTSACEGVCIVGGLDAPPLVAPQAALKTGGEGPPEGGAVGAGGRGRAVEQAEARGRDSLREAAWLIEQGSDLDYDLFTARRRLAFRSMQVRGDALAAEFLRSRGGMLRAAVGLDGGRVGSAVFARLWF